MVGIHACGNYGPPPTGRWRRRETEGAFDGWNHLISYRGDRPRVISRPARRQAEVGDAFLEGKVAALLDGRRAASTSTLRGPHDEAACPSGVRVTRKPLFGGPTVEGGSDRMRRGWVSGRRS